RAPHEVRWDPVAGTVDAAALEGIDGLVHLAGESIFGLRWSDAKKARIVQSRVQGTRAIVRAVAGMERPPRVCVFASAIGFYGARGDEVLTEDSSLGTGFLAETCEAWEAEVSALPDAIREVRTRLGVVLDPGGGALRTMLPAFRAGGGGRLGDGKQWFPWIALDDVVGAMHRALHDDGMRGPVNLVAPGEVQNAAFTKALGRALRRPTIVPVPRFALKAAIGAEQASELLLASSRVRPQRLLDAGYPFSRPDLDGALLHALGRSTEVPGRVDPDTLRTLRGTAPG
ncbi:MAG: TIGR01777 family oxidoreductase, partial [Planctomycetota bacterium]